MFDCAPNVFGADPNTMITPVFGQPSLPVVNEKAVEYAIKIGLVELFNCHILSFVRKSYFYPDIPKNFPNFTI